MVRSESLRVDSGDRTHRIFRPSDLIQGEVLGKGFFGQAVKVPQLNFCSLSLCFYDWLCCQFIDFNRRCDSSVAVNTGNTSGDWGGDGDERVDTVWRRDTEDFLKGGEWPSEKGSWFGDILCNIYPLKCQDVVHIKSKGGKECSFATFKRVFKWLPHLFSCC